MKNSIRSIGVVCTAALGLSACASGTTLSESAPSVPAVQRDEARLVFYRTQLLGAAVQPKIFVNGSETDTCQPNKVFFVDVRPGTHLITASTENKETLSVNVLSGETKYVECEMDIGFVVGRVDLKVVAVETGVSEVGPLAFSGLYERK